MSMLRGLEQAFPGAKDCTGPAMQAAVEDWFRLYFDDAVTEEEDPCQRLPVAIVGRLGRACFSEYSAAPIAMNEGAFSGNTACSSSRCSVSLKALRSPLIK